MNQTSQVEYRTPHCLPVLAIVGRPNVGKSSLFNRLTRERKAIVNNLPGVTRDRNYAEVEWYGRRFVLIDTGGFETNPEKGLKEQIQEQSRLAIEEADAILFLFDGKEGLNPLDEDAVKLLRQVQKPRFFAVNKIDTQPKEGHLYEFYALGLNEIFPLSAEHGLGLSELMDRIVETFPAGQEAGESKEDQSEEQTKEKLEEEEKARPLSIAIVGRPNVGKSSLVNRLLGYDRSVVDARPGTTRDAVDSPLQIGEELYTLVDTAGVRRKSRIVDQIERFSVIRSLRSVDRGDLIIHLLDGPEGVTDQDAQILAYAFQRGKAVVLAVNKWDLVDRDQGTMKSYSERVYRKLSFVNFAPLVYISALTGYGVEKMMETARKVASSYQRKVRTSKLNQVLQEIVKGHTHPLARGREVKFFYATQTGLRPPTFMLFVNSPKGVTTSYQRYLVHQLRLALRLKHSPIRLLLRGRRDEKRRIKR